MIVLMHLRSKRDDWNEEMETLMPLLHQRINGNSYICTDGLYLTEIFHEKCLDTKFRNHMQIIDKARRDLKDHLKAINSVKYVSQYISEWMHIKDMLERNLRTMTGTNVRNSHQSSPIFMRHLGFS